MSDRGRPRNRAYACLGFKLCKLEKKYRAMCLICHRLLKNTAAKRLKGHRNVCRSFTRAIDDTTNTLDLAYDCVESSLQDETTIQQRGDEDVNLMDVSCVSNISNHNEVDSKESIFLMPNSSVSSFSSIVTPSYSSVNTSSIENEKMYKKNYAITYSLDKDSSAQKSELDNALANMIFGCNLPLRVVESQHFKRFVQKLHPIYSRNLPNTKCLSTTLLDRIYDKCITENKKRISSESVLLIDGWKNSSSNTNTVVCLLHKSNGEYAFLHAWDVSADTESGQKLAEIVIEAFNIAMNQYKTSVYAVISINARNIMNMEILAEHALWHSTCSSHIGNLLAREIINADLNDKVLTVLNEFKHVDLENFIVEKGGSRLKLPSDTRWSSYRDSYSCLLQNSRFMKHLAADLTHTKINPNVAKLIFDDEFLEAVKDYVMVLDPICDLINKCKSIDCSIADSVNYWLELKLPEKFHNKFKDLIETRKKMALNIYGLSAYYLHPNYDNKKLEQSDMDQINQFLFEQLDSNGIEDWHNFRNKTGFFNQLFQKKIEKPLVFWGMAEMKHPTLAKLANKLFNMPATTAQIERIFSSWKDVHTDMKNSLSSIRSEKMLQIVYTLKLEEGYLSDEDKF